MVTASGTTGLTFPGIMLLPGCKAWSSISENPAKGDGADLCFEKDTKSLGNTDFVICENNILN